MKSLHIDNSYKYWKIDTMSVFIMDECAKNYNDIFANKVLNRSWQGMYVEWWLHNIGYYLTLPLIWIRYFKKLNNRFKHLDLEEYK